MKRLPLMAVNVAVGLWVVCALWLALFHWWNGPERMVLVVPVPDNAIQAESIPGVKLSGNMICARQPVLSFQQGDWSGDSHLFCFGGRKGDEVSIRLPRGSADPQHLFVNLTKARDYGIVAIYVNGTFRSAKDLFSLYITNEVVDLGPVPDEILDVTLRLVGTTPVHAPSTFNMGIDALWRGPPVGEDRYKPITTIAFRHLAE